MKMYLLIAMAFLVPKLVFAKTIRSSPGFAGGYLLTFLIAGCSLGSGATTRVDFAWVPPDKGVIRDKVAAISIAHDIWFSMNPSLEKSSDKAWQSEMRATLVDGIWRVRHKPISSDSIGGGLEIDLNSKDGRVVRIIFTQ